VSLVVFFSFALFTICDLQLTAAVLLGLYFGLCVYDFDSQNDECALEHCAWTD
jgi:hypothetical protein